MKLSEQFVAQLHKEQIGQKDSRPADTLPPPDCDLGPGDVRPFSCHISYVPTPTPRSLAAFALRGVMLAAVVSCSTSSPTGGGDEDFVLDIRYLGTAPSAATRASFDAAAATLRQTITAGLGTVALPDDFRNVSECDPEGSSNFAGFPDLPRNNIPGLVIYVRIAEIDGSGGTLGSAGPCLIRGNNIPALGVMLLDQADVADLQASGQLSRVVLHEMMHVLGFGTVWDDMALVNSSNPDDLRFVGTYARAACAGPNGGATACATTVPVHSTGGIGTEYSHWRESFFVNELMTPFLNGGANPFSATSVQSLKDLGYTVSSSTSENFTASGSELRAGTDTRARVVAFGEPIRPRWKLDAAGKKVALRRR